MHSGRKISQYDHSLSLIVISLSLLVSRCTIRCHLLYHSLSFDVTRCHSLYKSLSLVVTRCITYLPFYKWSKLCIIELIDIFYWMILGLCFIWKAFKTVNVNLWKSGKTVTRTPAKWKLFGWFIKMLSIRVGYSRFFKQVGSEAALHRCSYKKVFWKYAANLQENSHAEVWFQ